MIRQMGMTTTITTRPVLILAAVLAAAAVASCGDGAPAGDAPGEGSPAGPVAKPVAEPVTPDRDAAQEPAPAASAEEPWLTRQPRLEELRAATPPDLAWAPGSTEWAASRRPVPERLTEAYVREHAGPASPGAAMARLATEAGLLDELHLEGRPEVTIRAEQDAEDRATGVVLHWGALDDAVAGSDLRAVLRSADGSWYVERLEERFHCRRGVSGGRCV
jgi:hypothetical protein